MNATSNRRAPGSAVRSVSPREAAAQPLGALADDSSFLLRNRQVGWWCTVLGAVSGLILGLWSFDGPVPVPAGLGDYATTARRLARLGHIAFFGLGILNLLLASELAVSQLGHSARRLAAVAMNFGNVCLPVTLFSAAAYAPLKYLLPLPALAVLVSLALAACGTLPSASGSSRHEDNEFVPPAGLEDLES